MRKEDEAEEKLQRSMASNSNINKVNSAVANHLINNQLKLELKENAQPLSITAEEKSLE